ncbi:MAG: TRAP transporter substrate-binding protein [Rhodospirillaceae bacterium]
MFRSCTAALFLGAALAVAGTANAADITFKLAHGASDKHPFHKLAEYYKEAVEKKTGGKVSVELFPNRQLGDDIDVLKAARAGTVDAAIASSVLFPWIVKAQALDALQLPFLLTTYDNMSKMLQSESAQKMLASLDGIGLQGISIGEGGLRHFLSTKGPVRTLEDFKGQKTRIVPAALHKAMWEAVGANPTPVKYGEVYTALKTNLIDAVEINISSVETENLWESAKHLTTTGHYFWPGVLVHNKAKFDRLPEDVQTAMMEAGREIIGPQVAYTRDEEAETAERLKAKGVNIYPFDALPEMRKAMAPILAKWMESDPLIPEFVAAAEKLEK